VQRSLALRHNIPSLQLSLQAQSSLLQASTSGAMGKQGPREKAMKKAEQKEAERKKAAEEKRLQEDAAKRRLEFKQNLQAGANQQPPAFHRTTSLTKRKSLPPPPPSKKAKKSKTNGSKGTREEDLQESYDYVPDLAPEHLPYSNKDERDGDPDYEQSEQLESESELNGVNSDDEDQRRYDETKLPGFNRHAPRIPPPQWRLGHRKQRPDYRDQAE
jgi:hypothetical protein